MLPQRRSLQRVTPEWRIRLAMHRAGRCGARPSLLSLPGTGSGGLSFLTSLRQSRQTHRSSQGIQIVSDVASGPRWPSPGDSNNASPHFRKRTRSSRTRHRMRAAKTFSADILARSRRTTEKFSASNDVPLPHCPSRPPYLRTERMSRIVGTCSECGLQTLPGIEAGPTTVLRLSLRRPFMRCGPASTRMLSEPTPLSRRKIAHRAVILLRIKVRPARPWRRGCKWHWPRSRFQSLCARTRLQILHLRDAPLVCPSLAR